MGVGVRTHTVLALPAALVRAPDLYQICASFGIAQLRDLMPRSTAADHLFDRAAATPALGVAAEDDPYEH
jgi:hypothetical protein